MLLFSASPRRVELLSRIGITGISRPVDVDEEPLPGLSADRNAIDIAERKMRRGLSTCAGAREHWALSADTLIEISGFILGKPDGPGDARRMLQILSGVPHCVHTAFCVRPPGGQDDRNIRSHLDTTTVYFRKLGETEIDWYLDTGEWYGAAGAYRIQQFGEVLIDRIEGRWSTVVGLPLGPLYAILTSMSYPFGSTPAGCVAPGT